MSEDSGELGEIFIKGPSDPDAQATVTDFIDYTEYLPSDLVRSLTLIRGLDDSYQKATASVHELTKTYGDLPNLPLESRPRPHELRKQISDQLRRALNARESAYAESSRLYDTVDRHFDRLGGIKSKLKALYNNITPEDIEESSAAVKDAKRPIGTGDVPTPRITLRVDGPGQGGTRRRGESSPKKEKGRGTTRREIKAGQELDSTLVGGSQNRAGLPATGNDGDLARPKKEKTGRAQTRIPKPAAADLQQPPPDAVHGDEHLPWLRLSDWEMSRLRKKMKKNHVWQPSEVMILRELTARGRGWEGYNAAKEAAKAAGTELVDCDDIENNYISGKLTPKGEGGTEVIGMEGKKIVNRGMKLNEAKKQKRENKAREQAALAAAEAELAAKRLGDIGSTFKSLFSSPAQQSLFDSVHTGLVANSSLANGIPETPRSKPKPNIAKKRKFEEPTALENPQDKAASPTVADDTSTVTTRPPSKRLQLSKLGEAADNAAADNVSPHPESTDSKRIPSARAGTSKKSSPLMSPVEPKPIASHATRRQASVASKDRPTPAPAASRTSSRRCSVAAASTGTTGREHLRRNSTTPAVRASTADQAPVDYSMTAAGRRSKRPAPGPITKNHDGGAAVSVGRRRVKPTVRKRKDPRDSQQGSKAEDVRIDEDGVMEEIDPNEPRYCLCGDVSFGTMICCEDNDVSVAADAHC